MSTKNLNLSVYLLSKVFIKSSIFLLIKEREEVIVEGKVNDYRLVLEKSSKAREAELRAAAAEAQSLIESPETLESMREFDEKKVAEELEQLRLKNEKLLAEYREQLETEL